MQIKRKALRLRALAAVAAVIALLLVVFTAAGFSNYYLISSIIVVLALVPFFLVFERRKPQAREIVPIAVMTAAAVAGRLAFFAVPQFKPVTAVVIVTGIAFGPEAGFITGALSGFILNIFFGQGPWTPWQMFAWGLVGFFAGALQKTGIFRRHVFIYIFGALSGYFYGLVTNLSFVFANGANISFGTVIATYAASLPFDTVHAASTVIFLLILIKPLLKKLERLKIKYGLLIEDSEV